MRRNDLAGTGQVFRFTLCQYLKSRSTIISMILMVAVSIGSLLVAAHTMAPAPVYEGAETAFAVNVMSLDDYLAPADEVSFEAGFAVTYVYGVAVLILVMMSSGYVIRSVVEEKASRLVETLMLSISPLALIAGKILACLCLVLIQLMLMILGGAAAAVISRTFSGAPLMGLISAAGALSALSEANIFTLIAMIVSVLLGFFVFAEIAAISSACCDRMEDMSAATMAVMMPALAGYLLGCAAPAFQGNAAVVMSVVPVAGIFIGPAKYLTGEIGFAVLAASWAIQALTAAALAIFGKRVYAQLMIHRGGRIRMRRLMRLARRGGGV